MRILCAGDLHLGRRSSRLPAAADARVVSCAAAWEAVVRHAIDHDVDLVALSGDLVDQDNRYFEALGPLQRGLERLGEHGIATVAVAGNHDHGVLPELARVLPPRTFRLVGAEGRWERVTLTSRDGARTVHVDGWSFPQQYVQESPLGTYDLPVAGDAPVLGLLHCDLAPGSVYAPVTLAALRAPRVAMWLVGHIHAPALHAGDGVTPVLYPGSPQPMDPGETGVHGAWLVELRPGVAPAPRQIPLATVRYESVDVDVSAASSVDAARVLLSERVRAEGARAAREGAGALRHLSLRLTLTGASPLRRELAAVAHALAADLELTVDGAAVQVERVTVATRPARDVAALADGSDAAAVLARLLRDPDAALGAEQGALLRELLGAPALLRAARPYRALADDPAALGPDALRALLARQAGALLDELLSQKEARP